MKITLDQLMDQLEQWVGESELDTMALHAGEIFGGKFFQIPSGPDDDVEFEFTPNTNYYGAFGIDTKVKIYDANGMLWIYDNEEGRLYLQNAEKISSEPGQNGEYFVSLEEAIEWLNTSGYMEK